jgi:hypothetical protein
MAMPFIPSPDLVQSLQNHIGSRTADGESPADILSDLQSSDYFQKVGDDRAGAYRTALDQVAPNKRPDGKQLQRAEELAPLFNQYADDFVQRTWGGTRSALNSQTFDTDEVAQEALHRAPSTEPTGASAYKPLHVAGVQTSYGKIKTRNDVFIRDEKLKKPFQVRNAIHAAVAAANVGFMPSTVVPTAGAGAAGSAWTAPQAGNYYYFVTGINQNSESTGVLSAQVRVPVPDATACVSRAAKAAMVHHSSPTSAMH